MKKQWHKVNEKFTKLSPREMWLIILTGFVLCIMLPFMLLIDSSQKKSEQVKRKNLTLMNHINDLNIKINTLSSAVGKNVNIKLKADIKQYEKRLTNVDKDLALLSDNLINPNAMRSALLSVLTLDKHVSLTSFEVLPVIDIFSDHQTVDTPLTNNNSELNTDNNIDSFLGLYQHTIRVTLNGEYFQLRDYLKRLENSPWLFYWQQFNYRLVEHPLSELRIEIYTLSTEKEFVGV